MKKIRDTTGPGSNGSNQLVTNFSQLPRRKALIAMGSAAAYLGLQPLARGEESASFSSAASQGCNPAPVPIPGGFNARRAFGPRFPDRFFHLFLPGPGSEPSTIFNFRGKVAVLNIHGTGTRTELDPDTGVLLSQTPNLPYATDLRFMDGTYVGVDGEEHRGTFAFF
jgi:hypothetical protein